jgi:extracellular elastinolytic metalloproteinase
MGEGWSDYIALMTITDWSKAKPGDGALPKGIGTYVLNEPPNGHGIRQYPYSTNMKINPHTYADVVTSGGESHNIGEIWATVLWDMTWNIIQMDGINKDIFNSKGGGGNSVAYKLVMAGMKLQPCSPGFIDGRDAILRADSLLYDGKYSCAIWQAFARRGMGVAASQGSSDLIGDETVDFNLGGIIITKHVNKKIATPGCDLTYTIGLKAKAVCNAYVPQNYSVVDSLPGNARYVSSDGIYHPKNRTVTFDNIDMKNGDSITYTIKVKVDNNASFPDSVYLYDPASTPKISKLWITKNSKNIAWTTLDLGIFLYYSNDASVKSDEKLITREAYVIPGYKTTFSFFHEFVTDDFDNGGVMEITTNGGKTWEDLGPYIEPGGVAYTETITGNSVLKGRKAFSGFGFGYTTIDLSSFVGKKVKIRFRYATSDNSFAVPDGGTGWIMNDIRLSASPAIANTAKLFNGKGELKGLSTITIKIKGKNIQSADFVAVAQNTDALLAWHSPHETNNGTYEVERSTDNGATFKAIGALNAVSSNEDLQHYTFKDAAPIEGLNFYRIKHVNTKGVVDYSEVKALVFENSKTVTVYPNPAKDKVKVFIPGNSKSVQLQLINALGKQIKNYQMIGQRMELNLPRLSPGVYYLNVIRNGNISKHKIIIE